MSQDTEQGTWATQGSPCGCYAVNIAQPVNFCPKHRAVDALAAALSAYVPVCARENCDKSARWRGVSGIALCDEHKNGKSRADVDAQAAITALSLVVPEETKS